MPSTLDHLEFPEALEHPGPIEVATPPCQGLVLSICLRQCTGLSPSRQHTHPSQDRAPPPVLASRQISKVRSQQNLVREELGLLREEKDCAWSPTVYMRMESEDTGSRWGEREVG